MPLFTEINRLKAELDTLRPLAPEQEQRVLQKFRLEWNYNSNAIEGNALTLGETRSLLLHGLTAAGKPMRDHLDIKGHNEAVLWLEEIVRDQRPLTEQFIRGMHQVLLGEPYYVAAQTPDGQPTRKLITPGQYKTSPNNVLTATGEMFYFASPEETPARMTDLVDWYRGEADAPTLHPVALATEFHYRFVCIHPFDDGNGRMSRLLMNLILMRHGYPMTVIQATDRNRYLAALAEADAGEPAPFLRFIIENVEAGLRLMIRAAKGEAIDEPSDLDKKLALLKKQLDSQEDFDKATWNIENQAIFYENLLKYWLDDICQTLQKFDIFFLRTEVSSEVKSDQGKNIFYRTEMSTNDILIAIKNAFALDAEAVVGEVKVRFSWYEFRKLAHPVNCGIELRWVFGRYGYQAEFNMSNNFSVTFPEIKHRHPHNLEQIKRLNQEFTDKFYDFIAAKVAKADATLP